MFHYLNTFLFDRHRQSFVKNYLYGFRNHIRSLTEVTLPITREQNLIHCSEYSEILIQYENSFKDTVI